MRAIYQARAESAYRLHKESVTQDGGLRFTPTDDDELEAFMDAWLDKYLERSAAGVGLNDEYNSGDETESDDGTVVGGPSASVPVCRMRH